jgi:hypothetical protein
MSRMPTTSKKVEYAHQLLFCVPALRNLSALQRSKVHVSTVQADSWAREPVSQLHLDEAARAGYPPLHREARDAPRARLLRQPLRVLQAGQRTRCCFNQCCATGTGTFCLSISVVQPEPELFASASVLCNRNRDFLPRRTGTVMKLGSGFGFGSGSNIKCNAKVKKFKKAKMR